MQFSLESKVSSALSVPPTVRVTFALNLFLGFSFCVEVFSILFTSCLALSLNLFKSPCADTLVAVAKAAATMIMEQFVFISWDFLVYFRNYFFTISDPQS